MIQICVHCSNSQQSFCSSLMVLANGGNSNLQFMTNKYGCTEYIGGYVGKVDLPESKVVIDTALKLLSLDSSESSTKVIWP